MKERGIIYVNCQGRETRYSMHLWREEEKLIPAKGLYFM